MNKKFFETIKIQDGEVFNLAYHQARYENTLHSFGINKIHNLQTYINPPKKGLYRCRLVYSSNILSVNYYEYLKKEIKKLKLVHDDSIVYSYKKEDRVDLKRLYDQKNDCDDILIVKNGFITDTSIANIALYKEGRWFTPKSPLLKGTTRQRYIDNGILDQKDITLEELNTFEKTALLNVMIDFDIISQNQKDIFC